MKKTMETILIVDDHDSNRNMLRQLLQLKGYRIIEAGNGQEAIELFKRECPALILMDIMMPVMDGHQSASEIKKISGEEYVPIIFITALSSDESLTRTLNAGGDDFVGKPFNFEVIQSKITAHLRIRNLTKQVIEHNAYLTHEHELINYFFDNALKQSFLDNQYINYHTSPLSGFNGDLILSARGPHGGLYLLCGDFTGHGLAASLGTLPVSQVFFNKTQEGASISEIAREIHIQLKTILPIGMFFASNILQLDPSGSFISVWAGGLLEGYHFDAQGNEKNQICSQYTPLGILPEAMFKAAPMLISVEKGDKLYFYTDGITESRNAKGEMFGEERLHSTLKQTRNNRLHTLLKSLDNFCGDCEKTDDITIVELTCDRIAAENKHKDNANKQILPYQCVIEFNEQMMREQDPVTILVNLLSSQPSIATHRSMIYTLLLELYNNAVEHSLLQLDSRIKSDAENFSKYYQLKEQALQTLESARLRVELNVILQDNQPQLQITMEDNGCGFKTPDKPSSEQQLYGRGMSIIKGLAENIIYSNEGNKVDVIYRL